VRPAAWLVALACALAPSLACTPPADEGPPPPFDGPAGELVRAHSHNDYEQPEPLEDALRARFYSVEADVFLVDGHVMVSHRPWDFAGSLTGLYLDPLEARVDTWGSVYGDGLPFFLWIDFKDPQPALRAALFELLEGYDMLTRYAPGEVREGAVTVVLTGHEEQKRSFVDEYPRRRATRDEHAVSADDPPVDGDWGFYALDWREAVGWDGEGDMSADERARLHGLVDTAHGRGRPLRFWALPDHEGGWRAALEAGVDFINTDRVQDLAIFLRGG
jgi:hypothetical protein